jgi:hypothetical protein
MSDRVPTAADKDKALAQLLTYSKKVRQKGGLKEVRGLFRGNLFYIEGVKEAKEGLIGRVMGMKKVRGIAKLARMEYQGGGKWLFLYYDASDQKYRNHPSMRDGSMDQCLATLTKVFFSS